MRKLLLAVLGSVFTLVGAVGVAPGATAAPSVAHPAASSVRGTHIPRGLHAKPVCADLRDGEARCLSLVLVNRNGTMFTSPAPSGYGPTEFQDAYKLPSSDHGAGETVAVVDAYDNPNAEADLAVYRSTYGLPACTTKNGCFKKVDEHGGTNYPAPNANWGLEISLDLDVVSAVCPNCHILLVEANGGWIRALGTGVNTAVKMGAIAVSNSYENRNKPRDAQLEEHFYNHPGVAITAGSGDWNYNYYKNFPASSKYVIAVGGTTLSRAQNKRGWTETVWSGSGSGCAPYSSKPAWQTDTGCTTRTVADVAADASPGTGAAVYDTYPSGGWRVVGGTSESSPLIAAVFALAGDPVMYGSRLYENPGKLFDVTSGSNGTCSPAYLCTGGPGYDGPTGLGTPNGIGDF
jgi:subtilase family serine protease